MQAEMNLIAPAPGEESEQKADIRVARHAIDLMAVLQEKTKGNLSMEEQRLLDNSITEMRFRYLHAFEEQKKKAAEAAAANG